jgi:hypothetical protein
VQCVYGTGETGKLGNVGVILPGGGCGNVLCVRVRACVCVGKSLIVFRYGCDSRSGLVLHSCRT